MILSSRTFLLVPALVLLFVVFATSWKAHTARALEREAASAQADARAAASPGAQPGAVSGLLPPAAIRLWTSLLARAATDPAERWRPITALAPERATRSRRPPRPGRRRRAAQPPPRGRVVQVRGGRSIVVRDRPGGREIGRLDDETRFGSRETLSAVTSRGRWLGVASSARTDGRLGWVDRRSSSLRLVRAPVSIRADLSRRQVELWRGGRIVLRTPVAVGQPGSSTPTGHFSVTDKISGGRMNAYYGCCILALSGTQPNLPPGWGGGNRLAIHGTNSPGSIGTATSAGCLRAGERDLRKLMRRVPLGTPVEIRR